MWSGPRNISTALMYSFRERLDTEVFDEPLYGHYLATTGVEHPGHSAVLAAMDTDGARVVREVLLADCERPIRFYKNMAHHLVGLDLSFLDQLTNLLLTRNPAEMLASLVKNVPSAGIEATGLLQQSTMIDRELAAGRQPIVLDAGEVLKDPRSVLGVLCERLQIPFRETMLSWAEGPKPEDGVWARDWYANVHRSTGFARYRPPTTTVPDHLEATLDECVPLYERIAQYAIRA